jgi:hypothetical protein
MSNEIAYSVARTDGQVFLVSPSGDWAARQVATFLSDTILPNEGRWHQVSAMVNKKEVFIWFDMQSITEDDVVVLGMNISEDDFLSAVRDAKTKIFTRRDFSDGIPEGFFDDDDDRDPMMIEGNTSII